MAGAATEAAGMRAELARRIDAISHASSLLSPGAIASELAFVRRAARDSGHLPAITAVRALDAVLSRGERGPRIHAGLAILRDAIDSPWNDARTCEAIAAACSMRLGH